MTCGIQEVFQVGARQRREGGTPLSHGDETVADSRGPQPVRLGEVLAPAHQQYLSPHRIEARVG